MLGNERSAYRPQVSGLASEAIKRCLDVALSAILLMAVLPLLITACIAVALDSAGSPFYRQWRIGREGRPFKIIKLRTMVTGADRLGPRLTQHADPRITRVGSVLRRWSLDELPQLVNVLLGHMSLVGPRPELISIVATYTPQQREVFDVRPGLTGWAQVHGRDDLPIHLKLEFDREYVVNRTIRMDMSIMARTAGVVMSGRGTKR
jgi:lipopolysaccharide/colanic/teichoic acid biosynthesis glycosyltransferase